MRLKIIKGAVIQGFPGVQVGDIIDVPPGQAHVIVSMGLAQPEIAREVATAPDRVEHRDPIVESREPEVAATPEKPSRRAKPAKNA